MSLTCDELPSDRSGVATQAGRGRSQIAHRGRNLHRHVLFRHRPCRRLLPIVFSTDRPAFWNVAHGNNPSFLKLDVESPQKFVKVKGRFHDNRHTLITEPAESGAGDQTIMDIAGHVSKQMLKHYSHIRMEAKRQALESLVKKTVDARTDDIVEDRSGSPVIAQHFEGGYPQKSPQSGVFEGHRGVYRNRKSKNLIGSSGRTRTYNPSVNSRMLCH